MKFLPPSENRFATLEDCNAFMAGAIARDGRNILQYTVPRYAIRADGAIAINPDWLNAPYEEIFVSP